jgi:hypothetical protein
MKEYLPKIRTPLYVPKRDGYRLVFVDMKYVEETPTHWIIHPRSFLKKQC